MTLHLASTKFDGESIELAADGHRPASVMEARAQDGEDPFGFIAGRSSLLALY